MASYDVAVWPRSEHLWPEMVLAVQAQTAIDAVIAALCARCVHRAAKVAAHVGEGFTQGFIHRRYGVMTLVEGFDYQHATCLPMG